MPSSSAASKASRSVTTKVAPMRLLGDDPALGRLLVVLAHEREGAGLEGAHADLHGLAGRHHLLDPEILALELLGGLVLVGDHEHERLAGLDRDLLRPEAGVLDRDREPREVRRAD